MQEKPRIAVHEVTKQYKISHARSAKQSIVDLFKRRKLKSGFTALSDVSFQVHEGESVAVLGRNGSGKSTLLKLISGVLRPDVGWVRTRGRIGGLLEVGAGFHPDLTGRENIYLNGSILGMTTKEIDANFDDIVAFAEIGDFLDTEVKRYSSGMYSRLGFAVAVHTNLDVLLVDEVLSVGDAQFRAKCNQKLNELRAQGKTMFIVSHNAAQVRKLCERGIVLKDSKIIFDGPIEEALTYIKPAKPAARKPVVTAAAKPASKPAATKPAVKPVQQSAAVTTQPPATNGKTAVPMSAPKSIRESLKEVTASAKPPVKPRTPLADPHRATPQPPLEPAASAPAQEPKRGRRAATTIELPSLPGADEVEPNPLLPKPAQDQNQPN